MARKCEELRSEGDLLAEFAHRNITRLFGAVTEMPNVSLVMEYAAGGALNKALQEVTLPPAVVVDWARQIARGMNYLHNESPTTIVHRDLKSPNILLAKAAPPPPPDAGPDGPAPVLTHGNVLKITDFGLARTFSNSQSRGHDSGTMGTFQWMAPESIRHGSYSKASDVWSFGVVFWELMTSQVPYKGLPGGTVVYTVGVRGSSLPIPNNCPPRFRECLHKCWQSDPSQRPGFQRLLSVLQDMDTQSVDAGGAWHTMQGAWRIELAERFSSLASSSPTDAQAQRDELAALQHQQAQRQKELNEIERSLVKRSQELQFLQLKFLTEEATHTPVRPAPVGRRGYEHLWRRPHTLFRRRKSSGSHGNESPENPLAGMFGGSGSRAPRPAVRKLDIGSPRDFRHITHLGNGSLHDIPHDPNGLKHSPVLDNAVSLEPSSDADATKQCSKCFHQSPSSDAACGLCGFPMAVAKPAASPTGPAHPVPPGSSMPTWHAATPVGRAVSALAGCGARGTRADTGHLRRYRTTSGSHASASGPTVRPETGTSPPVPSPLRSPPADPGRSTPPDTPPRSDATNPFLPPRPAPPTTTPPPGAPNDAVAPAHRAVSVEPTAATPGRRAEGEAARLEAMGRVRRSWTAGAWYQPTLSRAGVRTHLHGQHPGAFVVRNSTSHEGCLAIAVLQTHDDIWNGLLVPSSRGWRLGANDTVVCVGVCVLFCVLLCVLWCVLLCDFLCVLQSVLLCVLPSVISLCAPHCRRRKVRAPALPQPPRARAALQHHPVRTQRRGPHLHPPPPRQRPRPRPPPPRVLRAPRARHVMAPTRPVCPSWHDAAQTTHAPPHPETSPAVCVCTHTHTRRHDNMCSGAHCIRFHYHWPCPLFPLYPDTYKSPELACTAVAAFGGASAFSPSTRRFLCRDWLAPPCLLLRALVDWNPIMRWSAYTGSSRSNMPYHDTVPPCTTANFKRAGSASAVSLRSSGSVGASSVKSQTQTRKSGNPGSVFLKVGRILYTSRAIFKRQWVSAA
eukprot:m.1340191 g.1340191  ORF g.1340191 m.1340191 type:complete len:1015 (+) comp24890_c1_seq5:1195-4239(+)